MPYVYMALLAILVGIVSLFTFQNLETVMITLFSASVTLPTSVWVCSSTPSARSPAAWCWRGCRPGFAARGGARRRRQP